MRMVVVTCKDAQEVSDIQHYLNDGIALCFVAIRANPAPGTSCIPFFSSMHLLLCLQQLLVVLLQQLGMLL